MQDACKSCGKGASGKYKKSILTRIGFFLLALLFLGFAFIFLNFAIEFFQSPGKEASIGYIISGMELGFAGALTWLSIKMLIAVFKK